MCLAIIITVSIPTILNRLAKIKVLLCSRGYSTSHHSNASIIGFSFVPEVSIHVAISSEDPSIVLETLASLALIDYPNYHVIVIDNNTILEHLWKPVEAFCISHNSLFTFYHVENLRGFKAGALNFALEHTAPNAELIAIVDADTVVEPDYLKETVIEFYNEKVAVVQSPLA